MNKLDLQQEPFLPLLPFSRQKTPDYEYVAKIAKSLQWWDRWRWLAILFHVAILAAVIWLGFSTVEIVQGFRGLWPNQNQNAMPESVVLILGLKIGFFFHSSLMGVLIAFAGFRTERLLVQSFEDRPAHIFPDDCPMHVGNIRIPPTIPRQENWILERRYTSLVGREVRW